MSEIRIGSVDLIDSEDQHVSTIGVAYTLVAVDRSSSFRVKIWAGEAEKWSVEVPKRAKGPVKAALCDSTGTPIYWYEVTLLPHDTFSITFD